MKTKAFSIHFSPTYCMYMCKVSGVSHPSLVRISVNKKLEVKGQEKLHGNKHNKREAIGVPITFRKF